MNTSITTIFSGEVAGDAVLAERFVLGTGDGNLLSSSAIELATNLGVLESQGSTTVHLRGQLDEAIRAFREGRTPLQDFKALLAGFIHTNPALYMMAMQDKARPPTRTGAERFARDPKTFLRLLKAPEGDAPTTAPASTPAGAQTAPKKPVVKPTITEAMLGDIVRGAITDETRISKLLQNYRHAMESGRITERGNRSLAVVLQGEENLTIVEALLTISATDSFGITLDKINDVSQPEQAVEVNNHPILVWNAADNSPKKMHLLDRRIAQASAGQALGLRNPPTLIVTGTIPSESFRNNFFERHPGGNIIVIGGKYFTHFYLDISLSPHQPTEMKIGINRVSGEEAYSDIRALPVISLRSAPAGISIAAAAQMVDVAPLIPITRIPNFRFYGNRWRLNATEKNRLENLFKELPPPAIEPALTTLNQQNRTSPDSVPTFLRNFAKLMTEKRLTKGGRLDLVRALATEGNFQRVQTLLRIAAAPQSGLVLDQFTIQEGPQPRFEEQAMTKTGKAVLVWNETHEETAEFPPALIDEFIRTAVQIRDGNRTGLVLIVFAQNISAQAKKSFFDRHPKGAILVWNGRRLKRHQNNGIVIE